MCIEHTLVLDPRTNEMKHIVSRDRAATIVERGVHNSERSHQIRKRTSKAATVLGRGEGKDFFSLFSILCAYCAGHSA
jgi:hypothetical protein